MRGKNARREKYQGDNNKEKPMISKREKGID